MGRWPRAPVGRSAIGSSTTSRRVSDAQCTADRGIIGSLDCAVLVIGGALGGIEGLVIAFVFALLMNVASYWFSDKIVLTMYGAREVSPREAPDLYRLVQRLAQRAGIPMPRVYIIPSDAPNAFATGRNPQHGAVAVTEGIL